MLLFLLKVRAARELEDLRQEKESLVLMKQQLAAVHQLRIDLQRKDSVIQVTKIPQPQLAHVLLYPGMQ